MIDWQPSIIIVIYNGLAYLPGCLASVLRECQAYPGSEVVVVDNASSDGSPDWIAEHYPQVRLLRNTHNLGFAASCNQGAAAASGNALVFLNQDTRVLPGWLKGLLDGLFQHDGAGLVTSKLLFMTQPDKINLCGQDIHYTGLVFGRGTLCAADDFNSLQEVGAVSGASFAIRRALWDQLGGFDPAFFMYYEETDLSWRACLRGYSSWYIPGSVSYHDAALKPSPGAAYYSARNRIVLLIKHWKWPTLLFLLPAVLLTELIEWAYMLRLGSGYVVGKLRACAWLLGHPRQILQARQSVQAGRQVSDALLLTKCVFGISPKALSFGAIGQDLIRFTNLLFSINYQIVLKLTQWFKI